MVSVRAKKIQIIFFYFFAVVPKITSTDPSPRIAKTKDTRQVKYPLLAVEFISQSSFDCFIGTQLQELVMRCFKFTAEEKAKAATTTDAKFKIPLAMIAPLISFSSYPYLIAPSAF
jgi:hypothetical protein